MGWRDLFRGKPAPVPTRATSAGPRFGVDRARMFDLVETQRLAALFQAPRDRRDDSWIEAFYDAAWNASIAVTDPPHFDGPDGLPYFRMDIPRAGATFDSQSLSNLARGCIERNAGAALFASPDDPIDAPQFVLSMGLLDSLLRYDSPLGDPIDRAESAEPEDLADYSLDHVGERHQALTVTATHKVLIGTPSLDFLPPYAARALHRYMSVVWEIEDPRVALLVDHSLRPRRNLVIGRKRSEFGSDTEFDDSLKRLFWFLPRYRAIILMPEDWRLEDMARLSELGDT